MRRAEIAEERDLLIDIGTPPTPHLYCGAFAGSVTLVWLKNWRRRLAVHARTCQSSAKARKTGILEQETTAAT